MSNNYEFYIEKDNNKYKAQVITDFEIYGDRYCIYKLVHDDQNNVYCAKYVDNNLVKIDNEEELNLTKKIVTKLIESLKV